MTDRRRGRWSGVNRLVKPYRAQLTGLGLMSTAGALAEAMFLVTITYTGLAYAEGNGEFSVAGVDLSIGSALWLSGVFITLRLAFSLVGVVLSTKVTSNVVTDLRFTLSRAYLESSWSSKQSEPVGQLQQLLVEHTRRAVTAVSALTSAVVATLSLTALLGVSVTASPKGSLMVLLVLGAMASLLSPLRRLVHRLSAEAHNRELDFAHDIADLTKVSLEIEAFGVQESVIAHLRKIIKGNRTILRRVDALVHTNISAYVSLAYVVVLIGMVIVTAIEIGDVAALSAVMLVTLRSLAYGQQLQTSSTIIAECEPVLLSLEDTIERYRKSPHHEGGVRLGAIGAIEVKDLAFSYDDRGVTLEDISFTIEPGEIIGIVGPSGCGKTTLAHLLLGLRKPSSGLIRVSGHPLSSIDRRSWANLVGFVPQDAALISGTVAENIRFFRKADESDIEDTVKAAHLETEITTMPDRLATRLGSRGSQLSGGQRQRLAIARALLLQPRLLILDEPTASLDSDAELHIRKTLSNLSTETTVVVVAHRPSTLSECDRIMVLNNGRLVAFDRPEVLAEENSFFQSTLNQLRRI